MTSRHVFRFVMVTISILASEEASGSRMTLAGAIEMADVVVVGGLVEFRGGTFWDTERREGTLVVEHVLKGTVPQRRLKLSFSDGWLDYSLPAMIRRSWWLILISIGVLAAAIADVKRRRKGHWTTSFLAAAVICVLWSLFLPCLGGSRHTGAPKSVSAMTETSAVWPLWPAPEPVGYWQGGPYHVPTGVNGRSYLARQEDHARQLKLSPETLKILAELRTQDRGSPGSP